MIASPSAIHRCVWLPEHRRARGLGKWLAACVFSHPSCRGFAVWMPGHRGMPRKTLYALMASTPSTTRGMIMQKFDPDAYKPASMAALPPQYPSRAGG